MSNKMSDELKHLLRSAKVAPPTEAVLHDRAKKQMLSYLRSMNMRLSVTPYNLESQLKNENCQYVAKILRLMNASSAKDQTQDT